jgi:phage-related minor tail protein
MLASGLMSLSGYIGAAIGVYQIFDAALSRNGKQVEAFNSSIEKSEELIDNANRVQKEFGSEVSTNAIYARSNSLEALSRSATEVTTNFQKALDSSSIWDTVGDKIKSAFGFGLQADFAENIAKQWSSQLSLIPEGPLRTAIESKIKQAAGSSTVSIEDLVAGLRRQSRSEVAGKVTEVNRAVAEQSRLQKQESTAAKVVQENFKSIDTAAQNVINTLKITDPIGQFGEELLKLGMNMGKAFQFAEGGLATLKEALKDTQTLRFVDPKALEQLRSIETSLPKISQELAFWNEKAAEAQKLVDEKNTPILKRIAEVQAQTNITQAQKDTITGGLRQTLDTRTKEVETATRMQQAYQKAFNDLRQQLSLITKSISTAGAEYINQARTAAQEQARISFSRFILKGAEGTEGFAKRQLELTLRELDQQERQITVAERLNNTMIQNSIINERGNALLEQGRLEEKQKKPGEKLSPEEEARLADVKEAGRNLGILLNRIQSGKFNLEEPKSDTPIVQGFMTQLQLASVQSAAAKAAVEGKRTEARVEEKTGTLQETQRAANLRSQYQSDLLQKQQQLNGLIETGLEYLTASELSERQRLQTLVLEDQQKRAIKQIDDEIELTSKRMLESSGEDLRVLFNKSNELGTQRVRLKELQALDEQILGIQQEQLKISNQLSESLAKRQQKYTLQTLDLKGTEQETNAALELLQLQNQINPMRADDFARREKSIKLQQIENENTRGLADLEKQRDDVRLRAQADIDKLLAANSQADISAILEKLRVDEIVYQKEAEYLKRSIDLKKQSLNLTYSLSERQKAYDKIFENSFNSLADAIVNWAETGKWAGKDLFKSLTAELLKFELRAQTSQLYSAAIRPGLLSLFKPSFNNQPGVPTTAPDFEGAGFFLNQAKGGAFDLGIKTYAKGGMFTNSIVNQPTLFKFARGTGLMGEAGPEAIMPLKRDSQGNLGVRSTGQKTEVVINNYSGERAEAKETVDSRGNRKVEVVIGEAAALDLSTAGSSSQKSLRSTFGLAPQLIRR